MNNKYSHMIAAVLVLMIMTAAGAAQAAPILIANNDVPESALSGGQVKDVFLGKSAQWSNGNRVMLSMLKGGEVSKTFLTTNVKKSSKQFSTFWKKAVFSGTGEMPAAFAAEADLVEFVAGTPGAIGYIDEATPHDGVKVIAIN